LTTQSDTRYTYHMSTETTEIPAGLCQCGCGKQTTVPDYTHRRHGIFKGVPRKYLPGHNPQTHKIVDPDRPHKDARRCKCGGWRNRSTPQCRECWNLDGKPPVDPNVYLIGGKPRRKIPLTQGQYALVDEHNYERMMQFHYYAHWSPLKRGFYAKRSVSIGNCQSMPVPMQYDVMTPSEGKIIDHIASEDQLNNCEDNLREADPGENSWNRRTGTNNTSGRKNVINANGRFYVRIVARGVKHSWGPFDTFEEACEVQEAAIKQVHGEFARVE
jgi:hypothetical protein